MLTRVVRWILYITGIILAVELIVLFIYLNK